MKTFTDLFADCGFFAREARSYWLAFFLMVFAAPALRGNPSSGNEFDRALRAYRRHDYAAAVSLFSAAIAADPDNAVYHMHRGNAFAELKKYDQALSDYSRAIQLQPANAEPHYLRAVALYEAGNEKEALGGYTDTLRIDPSHANALLNRAWLHRRNRDPQKALADYQRLIGLWPDNPRYRMARAALLVDEKHYQEAIADLDKAVEITPKAEKAYSERGDAWHLFGNDTRAMADYRTAIRLGARNASVFNNLASLLLKAPDNDAENSKQAVLLAEQALKNSSARDNLPAIYDTLANAYERAGHPEKARKFRLKIDAMNVKDQK